MQRFIHRHILLPAFESLYHRRKTLKYLKDLEKTQWLSRAELEQRQLGSLRQLVQYAVANCPYYRDTWRDRGLDPAGPKSLEDFRNWPVIDRATIMANRAQMRTQSPNQRIISKSTGGSSGEPLKFDLNFDSGDRRAAASHRGYEWAGAQLGAKLLYLWGVALGKQSRMARWKEALYHGLYRRKMLTSFDLTEERVPQFLEAHNRYRPDVVVAYTNPLYEFARMLQERNLKPFSPKSLIVGAEKLHDFQRELIQKVFQAPVFETYGSREFMLMAAECDRHEGLHLTTEQLVLEVLDDIGNPTPEGQEGNVAVTDLFNYGMPFVRYLNGDRAVAGWSTCSCGRGLPLMKPVLGRVLDVLHTPDGRNLYVAGYASLAQLTPKSP